MAREFSPPRRARIQLDGRPGSGSRSHGAIATALGLRDDAGLTGRSAILARHRRHAVVGGRDDARDLLNRALCRSGPRSAASTDRPGQEALLDEVARRLWQAFPLDPSLASVARVGECRVRGVDAAAANDLVRDRSPGVPTQPLVGYRRRPGLCGVMRAGDSRRRDSFAERRGARNGGRRGRLERHPGRRPDRHRRRAYAGRCVPPAGGRRSGSEALTHQAGTSSAAPGSARTPNRASRLGRRGRLGRAGRRGRTGRIPRSG